MKHKLDSSSFDKEVIRGEILADIKKRECRKPKILVTSICIAVLFALTGCAVAVEMNEYSQAVEFFNEYKLSTEGYTRSEIKAVYKDITRHTYSNSKTLELLNNISVMMYQNTLDSIPQNDYDKLLNDYYLQNSENEIITSFGDYYYLDKTPNNYEKFGGVQILSKSEGTQFVTNFDGNEVKWEYRIPDKYTSCELSLKFDGGFIVSGRVKNPEHTSGYEFAGVFILDNNGKLIFEHCVEKLNSKFLLATAHEDMLILSGKSFTDSINFVLVVDDSGDIISETFYSKKPGEKTVTPKKILTDSDKLVLVDEIVYSDNTTAIRLTSQSYSGEWMSAVKYTEGNTQYYFNDAFIKNGKIFISAYYRNSEYEKYSDVYKSGGEAFLEYLKEFNSVLLILDESQTLSKVYTIEQAIPIKIESKEGGNHAWVIIHPLKNVTVKVHDLLSSFLNPPPREEEMIGMTQFEYIFDEVNKFIEKKEVEVKIKDYYAFKNFFY